MNEKTKKTIISSGGHHYCGCSRVSPLSAWWTVIVGKKHEIDEETKKELTSREGLQQ
jgi:hypothetical protein